MYRKQLFSSLPQPLFLTVFLASSKMVPKPYRGVQCSCPECLLSTPKTPIYRLKDTHFEGVLVLFPFSRGKIGGSLPGPGGYTFLKNHFIYFFIVFLLFLKISHTCIIYFDLLNLPLPNSNSLRTHQPHQPVSSFSILICLPESN